MKELGKRIEKGNPFVVPEGEGNMYYGVIGSGKTYGATADIVELVKQGRVVYATWPIALECFDDRFDFFMSLKNLVFWRKYYYRIDTPKNFHFINAETGEVDGKHEFDETKPSEYINYLNRLNHCHLFIDEAWRVIDSYTSTRDFSVNSRNLILVTRHKFRTVNLIAQRPTSVQVTARANMNRFYKFEKISNWPWVRFRRSEYQEMVGETVDDTKEPLSVKTYWASKKIFNAYNSYFYGELKPLHEPFFETHELKFVDRCRSLVFSVLPALRRKYEKNFLQVDGGIPSDVGGQKRITSIKNTRGLNTAGVGEVSYPVQEDIPF